ncbi:hypothetical protein EJV47_06360 [Hymenobacter gummosus]|uniref:Uncharacterized protein n=1 Tax=Hymenobacter gummosus TaxID=1776032 RepID=A0A3S0K6T8_9BACT|nr:hypothetical protein [Hymenobacter gummosus]RTQ51423.1 hypothetical protein EJV47_06360 [Hymenobacter gummosus]
MHPPLRLDASTGHLQLGPTGSITPTTTPADLARLFPAASITPYNLGNGWHQYHLQLAQDGWFIGVVLQLVGRYFVQWQLVFTQDRAPRNTWADWDEPAERQQALRYQQWLTTQLGPADERWQLDWGEAWVGYDARSGSSSIVVRYGGPAPTPQPA